MNDENEEPYTRWHEPLRGGGTKVVEMSRRKFFTRVILIIMIWTVLIAFFGLLEGAEVAMVLIFLAFLAAGAIVFHFWYTGREGVGKAPGPIFGGDKKKGV